jgi:hypothetical protein
MSSIAVYNQFRIEIYIQHSIRIEKKITRVPTFDTGKGPRSHIINNKIAVIMFQIKSSSN